MIVTMMMMLRIIHPPVRIPRSRVWRRFCGVEEIQIGRRKAIEKVGAGNKSGDRRWQRGRSALIAPLWHGFVDTCYYYTTGSDQSGGIIKGGSIIWRMARRNFAARALLQYLWFHARRSSSFVVPSKKGSVGIFLRCCWSV